ncbi:MAG TPA: hypothetical protein VGH77_18760 [Streptosporangiaceae bacterium]
MSADRTTQPRGAAGRPWAGDDPGAADEPLVPDPTGRLTNVSFIMAALRRRARLWCATAAIGLVIGAGLYLKHPPAYQASTTVLLTLGPNEDLNTAITTEAVVAASRPVAGDALRALRLNESVDSFLTSYTVLPLTNRVLLITASAPTSNEAVTRANALGPAFLKYRAQQLQNQVQLVTSSLSQVVTQDQQRVKAITQRITRTLNTQPPSPARTAEIQRLQGQRSRAQDTLTTMEQTLRSTSATAQSATIYAVRGSVVLSPAAPGHHSRFKVPLEYAAAGLIGGAALGIIWVVVQALASSRLRRRDDIAHAIGAPVKLSLGRVRVRRALLGRPGGPPPTGEGTENRDIKRIAEHLRAALPQPLEGPAALAVVPVDRTQVAALSLVELALSSARQGQQVVLADLAIGGPAVRLVDTAEPGVRWVDADGARLVVAVPGPDKFMPTGPLGGPAAPAPAELAKACESADLLLTLAVLDPATGGEHLATWATDAVALVTAGESSWPKIHAVGEMIRLAGVRLRSAVLVGADKQDESLGALPTTPGPRPGGRGGNRGRRGSVSDPERVFAGVEAGSSAQRPRNR